MTPAHTTELRVSLRFGDVGGVGGRRRPVGRLALVGGRTLFEFDPSFLAAPLPLSPVHLPVRPGVCVERDNAFAGLFGLFDDSLPDGWGRLLLDREMERLGVARGRLTPIDRLAWVGEHGPGALIYEPTTHPRHEPGSVDLASLAAEARLVLEGDADSVFAELLALGGSSGGARPKVGLSWNPLDGRVRTGPGADPPGFVEVIVKFSARSDPPDVGAIEHAYAQMARAAGVDVAPTWLIPAGAGPAFFATQRFDRAPRVHMHSLSGLLHADHRVPSTNYVDLLKLTRWLTRDQRAVDQMYRRMVFNVLARNRDDHSRNFGFLMDQAGEWRISPAYDLTFSSGPGGEHWMSVAGEGRTPARSHCLQVASAAGVAQGRAEAIIEEVRGAVAGWRAHAIDAGVGTHSADRIGHALLAW